MIFELGLKSLSGHTCALRDGSANEKEEGILAKK